MGEHATPSSVTKGKHKTHKGVYTNSRSLEWGHRGALSIATGGESETWLRLHSQIWKRPMWPQLQRSMVHSTLIYFTFFSVLFLFSLSFSLFIYTSTCTIHTTSIICDSHFHSHRKHPLDTIYVTEPRRYKPRSGAGEITKEKVKRKKKNKN